MATIIGTPPTRIMAGYLAAPIRFGRWIWLPFGLPIAAVFMLIAWVQFRINRANCRAPASSSAPEFDDMDPMSREVLTTLRVFLAVAPLWIGRSWPDTLPGLTGFTGLDDANVAIGGAVALFLLPVDWRRGS